jgi:hypothetical protein
VESPPVGGIWLKLVNEPKFGLDNNIEERVLLKQDQAEIMVPLVHNTSMEEREKV